MRMHWVRTGRPLFGFLAACLGLSPAAADGLLPPLTRAQVDAARRSIAEFKTNPKGPFIRIRWFCEDGSVHPPAPPPPCAKKGKGYQHGELSPAALQLAAMNISAGTILAGAPFETLFDAARDHHRLKEMVLEKYLVEVDQGWIYRLAIGYRGARQIEDEERAGRRLLEALLSRPDWVDRNFFLVMELIDAVPHGATDSGIKRARNLAASIAEEDPRFQSLRVKIHSYPGPEDAAAVRNYREQRKPPESTAVKLRQLAELIEKQYTPRLLLERVEGLRSKFAGTSLGRSLEDLSAALQTGGPQQLTPAIGEAAMAIRSFVPRSSDGRTNLMLMSLNRAIQEEAFQLRRPPDSSSRATLLDDLHHHFRFAVGAGLLSRRQAEALHAQLRWVQAKPELDAETWRLSMQYFGRSIDWMRATVARDFGPLVNHYLPAEPKARGLVDHLLRSSMALPLSARIELLMMDADRSKGIRHSILGTSASAGVMALNPGVAMGPLGIIEIGQADGAIDSKKIYVIPETASDLKPVAGILSLDSGNALSHAQLLAANLGIPNAGVPSSLLPALRRRVDAELFYAVTPRGVVILKEKASLAEQERRVWEAQPASGRALVTLATDRLNLHYTDLPQLTTLRSTDSGAIVGPKAGNLGQLRQLFGDKVAPGFAVPFGLFHAHADRDLDSSGKTLLRQIQETLREAERMRDAGMGQEEINRFAYPKLARFREIIETMPLLAAFEQKVRSRLREVFGPDGSYGVFVRSDTNAEDLAEFTGAGLNRTVPNVVGTQDILHAIRTVWASPFTERAFQWRTRALRGTENVYPSVVVMRAVPSDKSGVIATMNLETGSVEEITVNVSEGVSAVVDGGVAESLLFGPGGSVRLLQQCRAAYRKVLNPAGGFMNLPATGSDAVLTPQEIEQVRRLVDEVKQKYPPARSDSGDLLPWDIEFGFEKGQLRLFQIRPLVRFQELKTLQALTALEGAAGPVSAVRLSDKPLVQ